MDVVSRACLHATLVSNSDYIKSDLSFVFTLGFWGTCESPPKFFLCHCVYECLKGGEVAVVHCRAYGDDGLDDVGVLPAFNHGLHGASGAWCPCAVFDDADFASLEGFET